MKALTYIRSRKKEERTEDVNSVIRQLFDAEQELHLSNLIDEGDAAKIRDYGNKMARQATMRLADMGVAIPGETIFAAGKRIYLRKVSHADITFDQMKSLFSTDFLSSNMGIGFEIDKPAISDNIFKNSARVSGHNVNQYEGIEAVYFESRKGVDFCIKLIELPHRKTPNIVRGEIFMAVSSLDFIRRVEDASDVPDHTDFGAHVRSFA